ncbi:fluoride efflux transporter FluC [Tenggerimyces flavus]|uniref:Fluoride-specific ion channel FluC n=1 Tax=Tenggerimyces flavus TaxID=1708749 RepID=A0ABV7YGX5_9ACTN|nr:CrcB family protein [Tenggerimyces flavus]MBM7790312.1 CrcB protein [Tenggerimyces flavus]
MDEPRSRGSRRPADHEVDCQIRGNVDPKIDPDIDPDIDLSMPHQRRVFGRGFRSGQCPVVLVVGVGGAVGAAARHGADLLWPTAVSAFPLTTLWINVAGCVLIGVLMVIVAEVSSAHRLMRPFVGTGVLGGFTTFSAYAVDIQQRLQNGSAGIGLAYLGLTVLAGLVAVWIAAATARRLLVRKARKRR